MPVTMGNGTTVVGLGRVRRLLEQAAKRGRDLSPVLDREIANSLTEFWRRQFDTRGLAGGEPWAPLTPATRQWKSRHNRGAMGPLRFSNRLWASLTKRSAPEGVRLVRPQELEMGTTVEHAKYHQSGWTSTSVWGRLRAAPVRVEPRKLVPDELPASIVQGWEPLLVKHLEGRL